MKISTFLALLLMLVPIHAFSLENKNEVIYCLSAKSQLNTKERIMQIKVNVASGRIVQVKDLPLGWDVTINNTDLWDSYLYGSIAVGAAAIGLKDMLQKICVSHISITDLKFKVVVEINSTEDFETDKIYTLQDGDFELIKQ